MSILDQYKQAGVKTLTVKDHFATAVNPYEQIKLTELDCDDIIGTTKAWKDQDNRLNFNTLALPPLPTSGIPEGTVSIEQVEEVTEVKGSKSPNQWININANPNRYGMIRKYRTTLFLKQVKEEEPKAEIERLREYRKSTTRWMSQEEQDRLKFLVEAQEQTAEGIEPEAILQQIKSKADTCSNSTKESRARKGAYIDCLMILKDGSASQLAQYKAKLIVELEAKKNAYIKVGRLAESTGVSASLDIIQNTKP